ncbi:hypothetical protein CEXT_419711 [Caerostris extrusa]|uniref:Uncharacterized protein n=1 Tax=Caerostris extrusa TaxID=172846 RepID=A0AAV4W6V9_CAEEX|nr:hypothetical protein CEXT_419711 [Caerostris extrusa]
MKQFSLLRPSSSKAVERNKWALQMLALVQEAFRHRERKVFGRQIKRSIKSHYTPNNSLTANWLEFWPVTISSSISLRKTEISSLRQSSNSTAFQESLNGSHSTAFGSCQKDKDFILACLISKGDLVTPSQENKSHEIVLFASSQAPRQSNEINGPVNVGSLYRKRFVMEREKVFERQIKRAIKKCSLNLT